jgi:large subunit ribosomal protein L22
MEAVAKLNDYPTSPRKMRLLVDLIRGMEVEKALGVLGKIIQSIPINERRLFYPKHFIL